MKPRHELRRLDTARGAAHAEAIARLHAAVLGFRHIFLHARGPAGPSMLGRAWAVHEALVGLRSLEAKLRTSKG